VFYCLLEHIECNNSATIEPSRSKSHLYSFLESDILHWPHSIWIPCLHRGQHGATWSGTRTEIKQLGFRGETPRTAAMEVHHRVTASIRHCRLPLSRAGPRRSQEWLRTASAPVHSLGSDAWWIGLVCFCCCFFSLSSALIKSTPATHRPDDAVRRRVAFQTVRFVKPQNISSRSP